MLFTTSDCNSVCGSFLVVGEIEIATPWARRASFQATVALTIQVANVQNADTLNSIYMHPVPWGLSLLLCRFVETLSSRSFVRLTFEKEKGFVLCI